MPNHSTSPSDRGGRRQLDRVPLTVPKTDRAESNPPLSNTTARFVLAISFPPTIRRALGDAAAAIHHFARNDRRDDLQGRGR
jgi:hypothetical protein